MRWITNKHNTVKNIRPRDGQYRIIKKYALLPIKCEDGITVWFEYYWKAQKYDITRGGFWKDSSVLKSYSSHITIPESQNYYSIEL